MKKIADNPTVQLIRARIAKVEERAVTPEEKLKAIKFREDLTEISNLIDTFNSTFNSRGWLVYDGLGIRIIRKALELSKAKGIANANDYLVDCYDSVVVEAGIIRLWGIDQFKARLHLIKLAYEDYLCGRYHACIPVLLMMIDGVVADAGNNLGFFSDKSIVTAWDSITGHESGLLAIKSILYASRGKTEKNKITLPYRNGIMHGRDLGYANREVAAKCWGGLFAIRDFLADKRDEEANRKKHEVEAMKSVEDIQQDIQALHDGLREVIEMDNFKRKPIVIGIDVPATASSNSYPLNSPEKALIEFIELWQAKKYGPMADYIFLPSNMTKTKMAGRLRQTFAHRQPQHFSLVESSDISSCKSDLTVTIDITDESDYVNNRTLIFRLLYCKKESTELVVNPAKEGRWKIVDDFAAIRQIGSALDYLDIE